jgi:NADH-quinone oxidoreductase subunit L
MDLIWLIPVLPGIGALINGVVGIRYFSKQVSGLLACTTMGLALLVSLYAFWQMLGLPPDARSHDVVIATWIPTIALETAGGIGGFQVDWGFRLDPLSGLMILVVSGIGFLIHIYSTAYMHDESRGSYARYFSYLNLFCFFMLTLVLGSNFLVMFVGWEGVGLCSYLLIGYWYQKNSAADAGKKAFLVNRVGDWGFILGVFLVFFTFGTLDFRAVADAAGGMPVEAVEFGALSLICLLLFIGATGKSAQIPLYVWLPDAMEGPTPVSALIHAATMVTAGVYMVGRNAVLFSHAPMVMEIVMVVGVLTAFMAATIGLVQNDIKRVLAYSTVSQLGFMFLAMGVGAWAVGIFHLMTHAFFKALLFLCSGAVIHAMAGQQDMRHMGGLKKFLPVTYATMFIGTLAIAGIPPFSGFFSKDEILLGAYLSNHLVWGLAVFTAFLTAFYMFRLMSMTFYGGYRGPAWETAGHHAAQEAAAHGVGHPADPGAHGRAMRKDHEVTHGPADSHVAVHVAHGHGPWHGPHEAPRAMTIPLIALAVGAVLAGFVGVPAVLGGSHRIQHFLEPSFTARPVAVAMSEAPVAETLATNGHAASAGAHAALAAAAGAGGEHDISHAAELGLMFLSVLVALTGIWLAWKMYVKAPELAGRMMQRWPRMHRLLLNKYYVDEAYGATVVRGTTASAEGLWIVDARVVDGAVNGSGWMTVVSSWVSHLMDKYLVDGAVNLVGNTLHEGSFVFRRLQTGLIQNYALVIMAGLFVIVAVYLLIR